MSLNYFYILPLILLLHSCYNIKRPEKPENFLSKEKMTLILIDAALMNSAKSVNRKRIENNGIIPEAYIYEKHNIDSLTFAKNNEYYAYDIEEYDEIYNKVNDSLNKLKKKYTDIIVKEKKKKDSLKKLKKKKKNKQLLKIKSKKTTDNSHEEE